jgi:hypothetical protein
MAKSVRCPQCGADNATDQRRCRICAELLNPDIPDEGLQPRGLTERLQMQVDAEFGDAVGPTHIPGQLYEPDPAPGDGIVFESTAPPPPDPGWPPVGADEEEHFDPDALFRDMGRDPVPAPPTNPDEIRLPEPDRGPDPLWSVGEGKGELTSAEIERLAAEAVRNERMKKRPGLLNKVFQDEPADAADTTVSYATANGTASSSSDYNAASGVATIPANALSTTLRSSKRLRSRSSLTVRLTSGTFCAGS